MMHAAARSFAFTASTSLLTRAMAHRVASTSTASASASSRRVILVVARASSSSSSSSWGRERAADLAKYSTDPEDGEEDPLVHMGRTNKSALKRLAKEKKSLAKTLLGLPKSQVNSMAVLTDEIKEIVLRGIAMEGHIALKRHEGLLAKRLRGLTDAQVLALTAQIQEIENGTAGAVDPAVESLATLWRQKLLSADEEESNATRSEVFGVLTARDGWSFTRQELSQAVDAARKESIERSEKVAALQVAIDEEMKIMAIGVEDEGVLAETRDFISKKLKSASPKPSVKASRKLLKLLRDVAAAVAL